MEQIIAATAFIWLGIHAIVVRKRIADRFNNDVALWIAPLVGGLFILIGILFLTGVFDLPE